MNGIVKFRKHEYEQVSYSCCPTSQNVVNRSLQALQYAKNGNSEQALNILWNLRLKVDLSLYRRALINLTIAALLRRNDRVKYARECLDLLDILCQQFAKPAPRPPQFDTIVHPNQPTIVPSTVLLSPVEEQDDDIEELEHISDLKAAAQEIINLTEPKPLKEQFTGQAVIDPVTGMLSDPIVPEATSPTKHIAGVLEDLTLQPKAPAAQIPSRNDENEFGPVFWESSYSKPASVVDADKLPQVEGFLRDKYYQPLQATTPSEIMEAASQKLSKGFSFLHFLFP